MDKMEKFENTRLRTDLQGFRPGDTIRVHQKIKEAEKERTQIFEGVVIKIKRGGPRTTFTVRKVSYGVGVEKIFPLHSPIIEKIELKQKGSVRRSKLYYLRERIGKAAKIKEIR